MLLLEIIRDGRRHPGVELSGIGDDVQGNVMALEAMARIVREDVAQPDLRVFVMREVVAAVPGHRYRDELQAAFEFTRDKIRYRRDPVGVERVVDLWSTMYALNPEQPEGDCGVKSVFLATCFGLLGQVPFFLVMTQDASEQAYSHVYVGTIFEGEFKPFDPTPEDMPSGKQAPAFKRMVYPIFSETIELAKAGWK
jgi:hypothetical protein